jgi:hypothetical protein
MTPVMTLASWLAMLADQLGGLAHLELLDQVRDSVPPVDRA